MEHILNKDKCRTLDYNKIKEIDECLLPILKDILSKGIETIESCCGHGKTEPKIRLENSYDIEKVKDIFIEHDIYDFSIQYPIEIKERVKRDDLNGGSITYREEISFIKRLDSNVKFIDCDKNNQHMKGICVECNRSFNYE